jgi:hypothetical protein
MPPPLHCQQSWPWARIPPAGAGLIVTSDAGPMGRVAQPSDRFDGTMAASPDSPAGVRKYVTLGWRLYSVFGSGGLSDIRDMHAAYILSCHRIPTEHNMNLQLCKYITIDAVPDAQSTSTLFVVDHRDEATELRPPLQRRIEVPPHADHCCTSKELARYAVDTISLSAACKRHKLPPQPAKRALLKSFFQQK